MLSAELEELANGSDNNVFYSKTAGGLVKVHLRMIASLADQPERRSANHMMAGNGTYSGRWGHSIDLKYLASKIAPCQKCYAIICEIGWCFDEDEVCPNCTRWAMSGDHPLLSYPPPADYPKEFIPTDGCLRPTRLTFDILIEGVIHTHQKVASAE